ncbi:striatin-3-like [Acanthaster planci]|uniref:Striatin-3-like n=1 Tax=Acanthaster planci TaxID=133434 RepID=A0A8B8A054_ACAPL|nr:striatin-3-like [Acanthaster planci]
MENDTGPPPNINQINSGNANVMNSLPSKQHDDNQRLNYTIPGILHFIQHEWARFEMERAQWEVERAELQARIAFLQGERKGQENLKHDLVRRIKMLEYALKQERAKYQKLKCGHDLGQDIKPPAFDGEEGGEEESALSSNSQINFKQSRQLLRQYLQEIGYTDTILDVRSNRVRSLLGLAPNEQNIPGLDGNVSIEPVVNGESPVKQGRQSDTAKRQDKKHPMPENDLDTVLTSFSFLDGTDDDEREKEAGEGRMIGEDGIMEGRSKMGTIIKKKKPVVGNESMAGMDDVLNDPATEEALVEFDLILSEASEGAGEARTAGDGADWGLDKKSDLSPTGEEWGVDANTISKLKEEYKKSRKDKKFVQRPKKNALQAMLANLEGEEETPPPSHNAMPGRPRGTDIDMPDDGVAEDMPGGMGMGGRRPMMGIGDEESIEAALGLGELAGLTISNEADPLSYDVSTVAVLSKALVETLAFHPVETVLITGSEDHTLKLWNLQKTVPAKKAASLDVEPIYTFRGHSGPVLSLVISSNGEQCFSGGTDAAIRCWNIPGSNIDPYDSYDSGVLADTYVGHTNTIWGLAFDGTKNQLVSCAADGTVRLWAPQNKSPLLSTFKTETAYGNPTSVDFVRCDSSQITVGYQSSDTIIFDLETGTPVVTLESKMPSDNAYTQINKVASHPTLPITITAHEDRHIRFFDNNSGKMVHSMVAHLDAVTSLAVDPNGLYLLSGSHDCSIRLWNLDSKTCVQEITSHRKKFDESIFDVAFHPSKPYIASGGADALAKVFV